MDAESPLNNPFWFALTTEQQSLGYRVGKAARYREGMSPFVAVAEWSQDAFDDLRALVSDGETVYLGDGEGDVPDGVRSHATPNGWRIDREMPIAQMIWDGGALPEPVADFAPEPLGEPDIEAMLALTALTEPGPFLPNTFRMGRYLGFHDATGRLVAMGGERARLAMFTEISAVCAHPDVRGRGYGRAILVGVLRMIMAAGKTPYLHVVPDNPARRLYRKTGFRLRRMVTVSLLTKMGNSTSAIQERRGTV